MIDLHTHSTASDGTCTPSELAELAKKQGITAVALTDHDTTDGLAEFSRRASELQLDAIPGIELATQNADGDKFHIVGLFINPDCQPLQHLLKCIIRWREERNLAIIDKLCSLGFAVSLEDAITASNGLVIGRPHIAQALVNCGHCRTTKQAFDRLIGRGCPGYVNRQVPLPGDGIAAIHAADGLAFWAHPYTRHALTNSKCLKMATDLRQQGLDGIEAYYPQHSDGNTRAAIDITRQLNLLVSGGSDFHGTFFPGLLLGTGYNRKLAVPDPVLQHMRDRLQSIRAAGD